MRDIHHTICKNSQETVSQALQPESRHFDDLREFQKAQTTISRAHMVDISEMNWNLGNCFHTTLFHSKVRNIFPVIVPTQYNLLVIQYITFTEKRIEPKSKSSGDNKSASDADRELRLERVRRVENLCRNAIKYQMRISRETNYDGLWIWLREKVDALIVERDEKCLEELLNKYPYTVRAAPVDDGIQPGIEEFIPENQDDDQEL